MSGVATAIGVGAVIGAGGSYLAAKEQSEATKKAAKKRQETAQEQMDVARQIFERRAELQEPFRQVGQEALPQLQQMAQGGMGPQQQQYYNALARQAGGGPTPEQQQLLQQMEDPSAMAEMGQELQEVYGQMREQTQQPLEESPYYQWRMGEQEEAINEAMAARGMQRSTPAVNQIADQRRALTGEMTQRRFGRLGQQTNLLNQLQQQNLGRLNQLYGLRQQEEAEQMQELGQMYNLTQGARQNQFNRLANLANIGQGAAAQTGAAAGQYATGATNALQQTGAAQAQGAMRQGNIWGNAIGQMSAMPMRGLQTYMMGQASGAFGGGSGAGQMSGSGTMQPWMFPNNRLTAGSGVM